ncbi:MAG: phospholipase D family protein [bacterium]
MAIKLIYHNAESASGGVSPFDEEIIKIVRGEHVRIACPYLGLTYIQRLIELSSSWQILTDLEEWISSQKDKNNQIRIKEFIDRYNNYIHHYKALHAKVIIAKDKAIIGSANFTNKGIRQRAEVAVLLDQEPQVEELSLWFDSLWNENRSVDERELEEYIQSILLEQLDNRDKNQKKITSFGPTINSKLALAYHGHRHVSMIKKANEDDHRKLVKYVQLASDSKWISNYFDLAKELIEFTGLASDDPRLVMSIPQYKVLPITINQRYVLAASFEQEKPRTCFIVGAQFSQLPEFLAKAASTWRFKPFRGEKPEETPFEVWFVGGPDSIFLNDSSNRLKGAWKDATLYELNRAKVSGFKKKHKSVVYEAVVNLDYRAEVLDDAFLKA